MKKSLLVLLPLATLALAACNGNPQPTTGTTGGSSEPSSTTTQRPSQPSVPTTTSSPRPASPYPAVAEGDGSEENPWNVTQAWNYVDTQLERTYETSQAEQEKYKSKQEYYIRGYVCYIEAHSDGRDPNHPHSVKFHMADDGHYTTREEVLEKDPNVRDGFCVYFADAETPFASEEEAAKIDGKLVTVRGYLLNWGFEPEVTNNGVIVDIEE